MAMVKGLRLFNTNTGVEGYHVSDSVWQKGMEWALYERMALNNATNMANQLTRQEYNMLPRGPHGEMYFGCSNNIHELPYFEQYVDNGRMATRRHFAVTRYGVSPDELDGSVDICAVMTSRGQHMAAKDIASLADAMMEDIVSNVSQAWTITVDKVTAVPEYKASWEKIWAQRARQRG